MSDPLHPIWSLIRLALVLVFLWAVLLANASTFDETELKVLGYTAIGLSFGEFGQKRILQAIKKYSSKGDER